ncbi:unnamed protein product [Ostreobium quekettii]|uniref:Uncharacterized protein n=1 Tax=Ostreobium quekettii TaxID=121088 RepID=A0A8S1J3F2_9CHLO|nr:unnamed protein product [Ostreobium quekettii]
MVTLRSGRKRASAEAAPKAEPVKRSRRRGGAKATAQPGSPAEANADPPASPEPDPLAEEENRAPGNDAEASPPAKGRRKKAAGRKPAARSRGRSRGRKADAQNMDAQPEDAHVQADDEGEDNGPEAVHGVLKESNSEGRGRGGRRTRSSGRADAPPEQRDAVEAEIICSKLPPKDEAAALQPEDAAREDGRAVAGRALAVANKAAERCHKAEASLAVALEKIQRLEEMERQLQADVAGAKQAEALALQQAAENENKLTRAEALANKRSEESKTKCNGVEAQLANANATIKELKKSNKSLEKDANEAREAEAAALEAARERLSEADRLKGKFQEEMQETEKRMRNAEVDSQKAISQLRADLEASQEVSKQLHERVDTLEKELEAREQKSEEIAQAEIEAAQKVILQLRADKEASQKVTLQLQADKEAAQTLIEQLKETVDKLGAEIEIRDRQSLARQSLAEQNEAMTKAMDEERNLKISQLEGQVKEAHAALADVRTQAEAMRERADRDSELQERIATLEADLDEAKQDHVRALQDLGNNTDLVSHLQAQVQDTMGRSAALGTCVDCEASRVAGLLSEVDDTLGRLNCGEEAACQIGHQALRLCTHCCAQIANAGAAAIAMQSPAPSTQDQGVMDCVEDEQVGAAPSPGPPLQSPPLATAHTPAPTEPINPDSKTESVPPRSRSTVGHKILSPNDESPGSVDMFCAPSPSLDEGLGPAIETSDSEGCFEAYDQQEPLAAMAVTVASEQAPLETMEEAMQLCRPQSIDSVMPGSCGSFQSEDADGEKLPLPESAPQPASEPSPCPFLRSPSSIAAGAPSTDPPRRDSFGVVREASLPGPFAAAALQMPQGATPEVEIQ